MPQTQWPKRIIISLLNILCVGGLGWAQLGGHLCCSWRCLRSLYLGVSAGRAGTALSLRVLHPLGNQSKLIHMVAEGFQQQEKTSLIVQALFQFLLVSYFLMSRWPQQARRPSQSHCWLGPAEGVDAGVHDCWRL